MCKKYEKLVILLSQIYNLSVEVDYDSAVIWSKPGFLILGIADVLDCIILSLGLLCGIWCLAASLAFTKCQW